MVAYAESVHIEPVHSHEVCHSVRGVLVIFQTRYVIKQIVVVMWKRDEPFLLKELFQAVDSSPDSLQSARSHPDQTRV